LGRKSREEIEHDAIQKLKLLDIEDQALKMASQISGGQKQRVAIARALINNPSIIMGDEPTGNLDSKNAKFIHELFFKMRDDFNLTFIIVTHNPELAQMADRQIVLKDGQLAN
jgi:lipoprotein-releasing system ATP-binding protein